MPSKLAESSASYKKQSIRCFDKSFRRIDRLNAASGEKIIDCGSAVRRFCPDMSLQQVHARKYLYNVSVVHAYSLAAPC